MNEIRPDFECTACGHGVFGKEPTRCPKCNGIIFRALGEGRKGTISDQLAGGMRRLMRDAADLREVMSRSGHRRKKQVAKLLADVEGNTRKALRILVTTPEPFGHPEKDDD